MSFILLYGKPGVGKSTMATTFTKLGLTVEFLDVDNKVEHMENISNLVKSKKVIYTPIKERLIESGLRTKIMAPKAALAKQPKGYLTITDVIDAKVDAKMKGDEPDADVFVLDSLTSTIEHFKRLIMYIDKPKEVEKLKLEFDHWNVLLANLEELITTLQYLHGWYKHVVVIAHEQTDMVKQGDDMIVTGINPAIQGSMREKIGKYFDEVYNLSTKQVGKEVKYNVLTKPIMKYVARTSRNLETWEVGDFSKIYKEK